MSEPRPIPLRPDPAALRAADRRSFIRACTALALSSNPASNRTPDAVLKAWRDDSTAARFLKAAQTPTGTGDFPQAVATLVLPLLAPSSASARLLGLAASIDLTGISTVSLPYVGATGRPPVPFIPEGSPGPVVALNVSATTLGPARKMLILAALTRETQDASAQTAETLIGSALATSAEQSLDAALFSSNAASDSAPPGLLHDVTPIASAGTTGAPGIADDLGLLADAISKAGIGIDDAVFIATAKLATKLRVLASPKFTNEVLSSAALADGEVVAVVPRGLATGYSDGAVSVEVSNAPIGVAW